MFSHNSCSGYDSICPHVFLHINLYLLYIFALMCLSRLPIWSVALWVACQALVFHARCCTKAYGHVCCPTDAGRRIAEQW